MTRLFLLIISAITFSAVQGSNITTEDSLDPIPQSFIDQTDRYYTEWFNNKQDSIRYVDSAYITSSLNQVAPCSDSLYQLRIDSIQSGVPLSYNSIVRGYIEMYTKRRRLQVANMLGLAEHYFPIFEEALDAECMPLEIKYLAIVESALNPKALSHAGASGLWQFMYSTGKMYKLEVNSFIDQRRDPQLSAKAAAKYLNDLYGMYEDWILALAAYNCGPGNVNKAIRRSGGKRNYWDIYYYLPKETRGYVPAFIAATYAFNYHEEHGIYATTVNLPTMCDTIMLNEAVHFDQIAAKLDISIEDLRNLNPQYKVDVIPAGHGKSYALNIPYNHVNGFIDNQDSIFAYNRSKYFDDSHRSADPNNRIKVNAPALGTDGRTRLVYTVKSNDVPGTIAEKFKIRLSDLRYWNNLNSRMTVRLGQKLVVYVTPQTATQYKNNTQYAGKVAPKVAAPKVESIDGEFISYTVRKGENLWVIAKKYPGVSNTDIMKWNGLSSRDVRKIKPGHKLKIKI